MRDDHHAIVVQSVAAGAKCLLGGTVPERAGWWYPPTVLTDVVPGMPAFDDELFGPTAAVIRAEDEDDAIRLANQTRFDSGSAVFTSDLEKGAAIARDRIEAGLCSVNDFVRSDPRLPLRRHSRQWLWTGAGRTWNPRIRQYQDDCDELIPDRRPFRDLRFVQQVVRATCR